MMGKAMSACRLMGWVSAALMLCAAGACKTSSTTENGARVEFNKVTGNLSTTLEADIDEAWAAGQAAIEEMQFVTEKKAKDSMQANLHARTATDGRAGTPGPQSPYSFSCRDEGDAQSSSGAGASNGARCRSRRRPFRTAPTASSAPR